MSWTGDQQVSNDGILGPIDIRSKALTVLTILAILFGASVSRPVLMPLVIAAIVSMVLSRFERRLRRWTRLPAPVTALATLETITPVLWVVACRSTPSSSVSSSGHGSGAFLARSSRSRS